MSFKKKTGFFKFLDNHLKNPEIQSYVDLLSNFSFPHKTIFKKSKTDSLYESLLFAYLEQQIILNNQAGLELIMKLIDSDTSDIYEWPHWNANKKNIKLIITQLKEKMQLESKNPQIILNYLYSLKENHLELDPQEQVLTFQTYLNILMRYIIITHTILNKDTYFNNLDVFKKFLENTKIYSLQQGFSEIAIGFLPYIFSVNFKLFCWEKKDESNNNLFLKKKYFITKDEKWKEHQTICLIQNEDMISYRLLPSKDNEQIYYKRIIDDICLNYDELIKSIVKYYNDYVHIGVENLINEFDIFKTQQKKNDPFELLFYENHNLDEINIVFTKLNSLIVENKVNNPHFNGLINDFVFDKTTEIENNFKELHGYIQKLNQYNSYKFPADSTKPIADSYYFPPDNNKKNNNNNNYSLDGNKNEYKYIKSHENSSNSNDFYYKPPPVEQNFKAIIPNKQQDQIKKTLDEIIKKDVNQEFYNSPMNTHNNPYIPEKQFFKQNIKEDYNNQNFIQINKPYIPNKYEDIKPYFPNKQEEQIKNNISRENDTNKDIEEQKFNGILKAIPAKDLKIPCPICSAEVLVDKNIITLECEHKICKECLTGWLMAKYDLGQWDLGNFKCFIPECSKLIDIHILKHIIGDEKFTKMCDKLVENLCMNCPYKECKLSFINEMKNEQKITCPSCKRPICSKCNEKFHDSKACPKLFNIALNALKNEKLNVCPECFEVYLKDDKCAHVKCMKCGTEFCFECSCLRVPTMSHGNHYHRLDCKFYFPKEDPKTKKPIKTRTFPQSACYS